MGTSKKNRVLIHALYYMYNIAFGDKCRYVCSGNLTPYWDWRPVSGILDDGATVTCLWCLGMTEHLGRDASRSGRWQQ